MTTVKSNSGVEEKIRKAYKGGITEELQLLSGTKLFKFSSYDAANTNGGVTAWWTEISELPGILQSAMKEKKMLEHYVRDSNAVLRQWNGLNSLIVIELTKNMTAYKGEIASQNEASSYMDRNDPNYKKKFTKPVFFVGGNQQVYINNISSNDFKVIIPSGTISSYDNINDIVNFLKSFHII